MDCDMNLEHGTHDNLDRALGTQAGLTVGRNSGQVNSAERPLGFSENEFIVYPAHGVGQISAIEVQTVAGASMEFFVIYFAKSKMKARVPTQKATRIGMRKLSSPLTIERVRETLGQATVKTRTNWSRLTKEYEAKIKSGDIVALAEVMRDLHRRTAEAEQSYGERHLYGTARDRVSGEIALVERVPEEKIVLELESLMMNRTGRAR
jgi:CarD family transcriptional regulator